jgi:hypothetical protein
MPSKRSSKKGPTTATDGTHPEWNLHLGRIYTTSLIRNVETNEIEIKINNRKTLRQPLLGELVMSRKRRKKKEKKMQFILATYVSASTHSARTKM